MNLKKYREQANLTQKETAQKLQIAQGSYSNYENNKREPDIATLKQLAKLFNTTVDKLIGNNQESEAYSQTQQELNNIYSQLTPTGQGQVLGYAKKTLEQEKQNKK